VSGFTLKKSNRRSPWFDTPRRETFVCDSPVENVPLSGKLYRRSTLLYWAASTYCRSRPSRSHTIRPPSLSSPITRLSDGSVGWIQMAMSSAVSPG
jgi:hypothetical protein